MYALFAVLGMAGIGWYPLWLLQVAEMAPKNAVASTVSFAMTVNLVAITLMPPVFGLVVDLVNYNAAWSVLVTILLLSAWQLRRTTPSTSQQAN
jgi:MFS family permease